MKYAFSNPPQKVYLCVYKDSTKQTARFVNSCLCENLTKVTSADDKFSSFQSIMYSPFSPMNAANLGLVAGYSLSLEEFNEKDEESGELDDTVSTMLLRCTIEGLTLLDATEMFESLEGKSGDAPLVPREDKCFLGMNMSNRQEWYLDVEKMLELEEIS